MYFSNNYYLDHYVKENKNFIIHHDIENDFSRNETYLNARVVHVVKVWGFQLPFGYFMLSRNEQSRYERRDSFVGNYFFIVMKTNISNTKLIVIFFSKYNNWIFRLNCLPSHTKNQQIAILGIIVLNRCFVRQCKCFIIEVQIGINYGRLLFCAVTTK